MTKTIMPGFDYYIKLNPNFLMSLAEEYLRNVTMEHILNEQEQSEAYIIKGTNLLELISKQIPGLIPAHLLLAKGKLAIGDSYGAIHSVKKCMEMDPSNEEAAILNALICARNGNLQGANYALQQAIANNFNIKGNPMFMLVKGEIEFKTGDYQSSLQTLEAAFQLINEPNKLKAAVIATETGVGVLKFSEKDRCMIYVWLGKAYAKNKRTEDARRIINEAITEFAETPQEVNVLIGNSEIAIEGGDIKKALSILRAVSPTSKYYLQAKKLMATVYLKNLKDRRHYAKCYVDLVDQDPSFENYKLLGKALLTIQEPEEALKAFQKAQEKKPNDENITRDIGYALVMTHNYAKALEYYENALLINSSRIDLRLDLSKLCIKINKLRRAEELLKPELFYDDFSAPSLEILRRNVDGYVTLHKLQLKKQTKLSDKNQQLLPNDHIRKPLERALQIQIDVIERCKIEGGKIDAEKNYLASLYTDMANYLDNFEKNLKIALASFEKALKFTPDNENILLSIAQIHLRLDDKENCEAKCLRIMKLNPNNDYASFMFSEVLIQKDETDKALAQFDKILQEKPDNFGILSKLIEFLRRTGKLSEAKDFLDKAQKKAHNPNDPGLAFCKALHYKYLRNPQLALKEFNKAKRMPSYQVESISHMIDIYLNPHQEL